MIATNPSSKSSRILQILACLKGAAPVGIEAETDAKARKTGNPFGVILKRSRSVSFTGTDYERSVNRELDKQTAGQNVEPKDFKAEKLPWGEWLKGFEGKVIEHKGELYLRTSTRPGQRKVHPPKVLWYRAGDGQFVSREDVKPFLPESRESAKQQAAGLDATVHVRNYKFDNIRKLRVGGRTLIFK